MSGATIIVEGVLVEFLTLIITNIVGEPTIESLTALHQLISGNAASVVSNRGGVRHRHLALTITAK